MNLSQSLELELKMNKKKMFFDSKKYSFFLEENLAIVLDKNESFQNPDEIFFIELFFVLKKILVYLKEKDVKHELFFDKGPSTFKISIFLKSNVKEELLFEDMKKMFQVNNDPF